MRTSRLAWVLVASLASSSLPCAARADEPTGRALFDEAEKLMKAGQIANACEKYAASQHEFARSVTLLRLADCYEKIGRTASAWSTYREVKVAAEATKQKSTADVAKEDARIDFAAKRIAWLEPRLVRVRVTIAGEAPPGLVVKRDGVALAPGAFGVAMPIDPGKHGFEATAEGREPWATEVDVSVEGATVEVAVPALAVVSKPEPKVEPKPEPKPDLKVEPKPEPKVEPKAEAKQTPPTAPPPKPGPTAKPDGKAVVTVIPPPAPPAEEQAGGIEPVALLSLTAGAIGMGIGGLLGVSAKAKYGNAVSTHCSGAVCDAEGKRSTDEARSLGNTATVFFAIGGALAAVGGVLWWTGSSAAPASKVPAGPKAAVGLTVGGVVLAGSF